jgi:hypothetical protein
MLFLILLQVAQPFNADGSLKQFDEKALQVCVVK